jgi:hypothetical protein
LRCVSAAALRERHHVAGAEGRQPVRLVGDHPVAPGADETTPSNAHIHGSTGDDRDATETRESSGTPPACA